LPNCQNEEFYDILAVSGHIEGLLMYMMPIGLQGFVSFFWQ